MRYCVLWNLSPTLQSSLTSKQLIGDRFNHTSLFSDSGRQILLLRDFLIIASQISMSKVSILNRINSTKPTTEHFSTL